MSDGACKRGQAQLVMRCVHGAVVPHACHGSCVAKEAEEEAETPGLAPGLSALEQPLLQGWRR